ncbi:hypothetical protein SDC9_178009 [bioreactor metagenome]|uniref:Uncharacterized protein n=1 Tax=bioreactor metagenome TaxID=1076179 RepID=A0A645GUM5_9ZZZZ
MDKYDQSDHRHTNQTDCRFGVIQRLEESVFMHLFGGRIGLHYPHLHLNQQEDRVPDTKSGTRQPA